jgi:hypothetical protein
MLPKDFDAFFHFQSYAIFSDAYFNQIIIWANVGYRIGYRAAQGLFFICIMKRNGEYRQDTLGLRFMEVNVSSS